MRAHRILSLVTLLALGSMVARAADANRLTYLDENDPYYVSRTFPKLITPQWVGEEGVEAVVVLAIDDMRGHERWEKFLRPILNRLKKIDGRAPVSIMTCSIDPNHPHLQAWLKEGVSLECHTVDHPCPLLQGGDLAKAKSTYDRCVDLLNLVPNSRPVAFRTPCCDSLNTVSPRFYAEIFNKRTPHGNFLQIDSSVFNLFTANDPELPRDLVLQPDGSERFSKYLPGDRTFVNYIEDYPYPYIIGRTCWEFPCVTPSDWSAQHYQKPANPITLHDWQAALDCTVIKQGVFCLVFHPYEWSTPQMIVDLIDHAAAKHGNKVKFLNFRECLERLNRNLLNGNSIRDAATGKATGVPTDSGRAAVEIPKLSLPPGAQMSVDGRDFGLRFIDLDGDGFDDVVFSNEKEYGIYLFTDMEHGWSRKVMAGKQGEPGALPPIAIDGKNNGFFAHSRHLWWQNEHTNLLKDLVDRRSFNELLQNDEPRAKSPEASLASIQVKPGFKVELMASEPLVQSPIAFAWGADGKLWVVEMGDYPLGVDGKGKPGGRIKFLEDTKGTGKYDKATVFLDNLPFPTGVTPWGKGVLVTCAPEIFYAEDTDGDGRADVRKPLFVGFHEGNQQHRVNGLVWGLDNWLYGANGDSGGRVKSVKSGQTVDLRGRDFRIRPDDDMIDLQAGQTQYGRSRDDWGNWFGNSNSNPMYHYVLADHYIRRNPYVAAPDPRVNVSVTPGASRVYPTSRTLPRFNDPQAANHFTSACSAIVYRDELFGPAFANNTFVSEPVHNLIHREIMTPDGVTFTSRRAIDEQHSEFLASSDNWFRPTMIKTGPDGALWIADMYRQVIEHPEWIPKDWQKRLDLRAGHDKGRIYRVYPVGKRPRPIPRLDRLDTAGLVAALDSPNGWQRDMAQQLLIERRDTTAVPLLARQVSNSQRPLCRLHALCTLDGMHDLDRLVLLRALLDPDPGVRRHAVRLAEPHIRAHGFEPGDLASIDDADPQVRLQLAYTLGAWDDARSGEVLGRLVLREPGNQFMTAAVLSSVTKTNLEALLLTTLAGGKSGPPPAALTENLLRLAKALGSSQTLTTLLDKVATPDKGGYAIWQFSALAGLLDALELQNSSLKRMASKGNESLRDAVQKLAGLFVAARAQVVDSQAPKALRIQAVRLLARGLDHHQEDLATLAKLLVPQVEEELRAAAVAALGRLRESQVPEVLLRGWKAHGPALRSQILDVLLRRDDWLNTTLDAIERGQILPFEIDAVRRQRLLQHRNAAVRQHAAKLLAGSVNPDRQKVIDSYRSVLTTNGDPRRGLQVFTKTCASCHQLHGIGHAVGPDLASLGDKSPESLLIAILDPNRAVEARYLSYMAQTKNGLTFTGVLASETGNSITLLGPEGKQQVILRTDLEELVSSNKSVMPEGLEKDLKPQDLADLISYVRGDVPADRKESPRGQAASPRPSPRK
jgi:putative membrane-bound dehydrogenase-like protein